MAARVAAVRAAAETEAAVTVAVATAATRTATAVKMAPREASVEEVAARGDAHSLSRRREGQRRSWAGRAARRMWGGAGAGSSRRGGARLLKAAGLPPPPPSWRARLRVHAATPRRRRRPAGAWAWSRRQQRRQGRRDPGRTEPVSVQRLARARTARQRAASTVCGRHRVATLVVSPVKGHAAAESGERACAAAHVGAGGGQSLSTGGARLTSRPFGSALAAVCNGVH